jgi:parallel beta-helix repeat protein
MLDGQGNTIDGVDGAGTYGVLVNSSTTLNNVTVMNIHISDWDQGISYRTAENGSIKESTSRSNVNYGVYLSSSDGNKIVNNTVKNNGDGIYLFASSNVEIDNNTIFNNTNTNGVNAIVFNDGIRLDDDSIHVLIKNNEVYNNSIGIDADSENGTNFDNITIANNTIYSNNADINTGLWIENLGNSTIANNTIYDHSQDGLYLENSSNTLIYNNFFNNSNANFGYADIGSNNWNTTKTTGTNIIGGPNLGGNFWAKPDGTGFSQTCNDLDTDGLCDSIYSITSNNTDYIPLATQGQIGSCGTTIDSAGSYILSRDIMNSSSPTCITISTTSSVVFDGAGHKIDGLNSVGSLGLILSSASNNVVKNLKITEWEKGFSISGSSSGNTFANNSASDNSWDFYLNSIFDDNTVTNLTLNPSISFTGKKVALKAASSPASDPTGYRNISKYINATNISADSWIYLNMSYSDSDASEIYESSLRIWRYNSTPAWEQVSGTNGVNTAQNYVYANLTSFSVFASFGQINITLLYDSRDPSPPSSGGKWSINEDVYLNGSGWGSLQTIRINITDGNGSSVHDQQHQANANGNFTLEFADLGNDYPAGSYTIYVSIDGGANWTQYDTFTVSAVPEFPLESIALIAAALIYGLMRRGEFKGEKIGKT